MPLFCRHNRLTQNCPICSRELAAERAAARPRAARRARAPARSAPSDAAGAPPASSRARVARAADDGYRNPLVPGLRATADAERLAAALAWADARLEPPGPHPAVAEEPDRGGGDLARVPARARPARRARAARGDRRLAPELGERRAPDIPGADPRTVPAYRAWAERAGAQAAAFLGEPGVVARAALRRAPSSASRCPGCGRGARYELLITLGAAGVCDVAADALHIGKSRRRDDARRQARARLGRRACCSSAAPPISRGAAASASARSTARSPCGARARRPDARGAAGVRAALGLRERRDPGARPRRRGHRRGGRRAPARVLPRRGRPARRAHGCPPLKESPRRAAPHAASTFLGAYEGERLVGAVSWKRSGALVDIHRLVVHPDRFRRGIAGALLDALERARARRASAGSVGDRRGQRARARALRGPRLRAGRGARRRRLDHDRDIRATRRRRHDARRVRRRPAHAPDAGRSSASAARWRRREPPPPRPVEAARARLPRARRAVAARPVEPDLRPVGVDHLGPRGRPARPQHGQRPVVEAAAGALHDASSRSSATTPRPTCGS